MIAQSNQRMENMLSEAGAELIYGHARLTGTHEVTVGDKRYRAERILIATGGTPFIPDFPGREHLLSSDQIFDLDQLPEQMLIIGGGYIACEFAGIFTTSALK